MSQPPTLDELLALSRKRNGGEHFKRIGFDHGSIAFSARKDKKRISIEVDTWRSLNLLPDVQAELQERHSEYLGDHPEVKRGGAVTAVGKTGVHFHVAPEDAEDWIRLLYEVVADEGNFEPVKSLDEVARQALDDVSRPAD